MFEDLYDTGYRYRAKRKIQELEKVVELYKSQYDIYEAEIDELNNAKVFSLKVIKNIEKYVNSIANKPKELNGVIVTPNIEQAKYESEINYEKKKYKKGVGKSVTIGALGIVSVAFLPTAIISVPAMFEAANKEKKNNLKIIDECNEKIKMIDKEIKKIQSFSSENVTEQEFLIIYSNNVKELMTKLEKTGIYDYFKFSNEQKSDLGALVNSTKMLIRRLDGR